MQTMSVKLYTDIPPMRFSSLFLSPRAPLEHSVREDGLVQVVERTTARMAQGRSVAECLAALGVSPR